MTKSKATHMEKPAPAVDEDAPVVIVAKRDPRLCGCEGVQRRYDGDGLVEQRDEVNFYRCSACGKLYA